MVAQRGQPISRAGCRKTAAKSFEVPAKVSWRAAGTRRGRRLNFNEKHALATLPKTIADLEAEGRALQQKLDDPGFFARDRTEFEKATAALGAVQTRSQRQNNAGWSSKFSARNWAVDAFERHGAPH